MTRQQEADLRDMFEKALDALRAGQHIARRETIIEGTGDSAVILAVGSGITYEAVRCVDALMDQWDAAR